MRAQTSDQAATARDSLTSSVAPRLSDQIKAPSEIREDLAKAYEGFRSAYPDMYKKLAAEEPGIWAGLETMIDIPCMKEDFFPLTELEKREFNNIVVENVAPFRMKVLIMRCLHQDTAALTPLFEAATACLDQVEMDRKDPGRHAWLFLQTARKAIQRSEAEELQGDEIVTAIREIARTEARHIWVHSPLKECIDEVLKWPEKDFTVNTLAEWGAELRARYEDFRSSYPGCFGRLEEEYPYLWRRLDDFLRIPAIKGESRTPVCEPWVLFREAQSALDRLVFVGIQVGHSLEKGNHEPAEKCGFSSIEEMAAAINPLYQRARYFDLPHLFGVG